MGIYMKIEFPEMPDENKALIHKNTTIVLKEDWSKFVLENKNISEIPYTIDLGDAILISKSDLTHISREGNIYLQPYRLTKAEGGYWITKLDLKRTFEGDVWDKGFRVPGDFRSGQ